MRPLALSLMLLGTILGVVPRAAAQTTIPGGIMTSSQTWTPAGSPYIVQGDFTVIGGRTLTIAAGTTVTFASSDALGSGIDTTRVELTIQGGTLRVNGTTDNPITFRAQTGTLRGIWYGIVLSATATASFTDFELRHAFRGLDSAKSGTVQVQRANFTVNSIGIRTTAGSLQVRDSLFSDNGQAIVADGGTPLFEALTVFNNSDGIRLQGSSAATVLNSVIRGQAGYGIYATPTVAPAGVTNITHTTIHGTGSTNYGILWGSSIAGAQLLIRNCIVTANQEGVTRSSVDAGTLSLTYSDVWSNILNYNAYVTPGAGHMSVNPFYVAPPTDLHLFEGSPVADMAEELGVTSDRDGTPRPLDGDSFGGPQPDMGAYEVVPYAYDLIFRDDFELGP